MSLDEFFAKIFFYRQHPDAALRYLPIVDFLKQKGWDRLKILEVGSGSYGITPYLKQEVIGVDISFDEPNFPLLKQVKGEATKLPFKEDSLEIVILSDVLEHLPFSERAKALDEAIRAAKTAVVVSGPFGKEAYSQDVKLANYSKKIGRVHNFFEDHLKFGLPEKEDVLGHKNNKIKNIKTIGEYTNLNVRELIMKIYISYYYLYLKGLMPFVPILRELNMKPCYRTCFLITL